MKRILLVTLVVVAVTRGELEEFIANQTQFTANVYKELLKSNSGNFLVSPLSVDVVLAVAHNGAGGETARQLAACLRVSNSNDEIKQIFGEVIPHLDGNGEYNFSSANKVYLMHEIKFDYWFKKSAIYYFGVDIQNIDFRNTEQAAHEMNEWVEQMTDGKIKDLVDKDSLIDAHAVLISALYFEGKWLKPFGDRSAAKKSFHVNNKNKVEIVMMEQTQHFNYYESAELKTKFLEMPYEGGAVTMTIVLPSDIEGLPTLEARIDDVLAAPKYEKERVHVVVPKFKTETSIEFKPILQSLGVVDAFEEEADFNRMGSFHDFSGLGPQPDFLKLSNVTQKAFIVVDERGSNTAAGSDVIIAPGDSGHVQQLPPKEFIADHPFIYYLRSPAGILFVGRYIQAELLKSNSGNFLVSPVSVDVVLALVHHGAKGKTAEQLASGLHLPDNKDEIKQIFRELIPHLQGKDNYNLTSANKVYLKHGFEITDQFKNTAVDVFGAEIQNIDFAKAEQAAHEMNEWVEERTHGKITDLVDKDSLDDFTRAVLLNALYFEGKWAKPFTVIGTAKKAFHVNNKNKVEIDMMEQTETFYYFECTEMKAKFLVMSCEGGEVAMTIVLPNDIEGLPALEAHLARILAEPKYEAEIVHVVLPKFKTETSIKFKPILQALDIVDAFEDSADFGGIGAHQEELKITEVVQKAFIEVEEKGTVGAAGSSVVVAERQSALYYNIPPKEFIADHPFIYFLKSPAGILFVGRHIQA